MSADLYQYRPPIDLSNKRLRRLAAALGPAYVRISGTWANTTYFADTDAPPKDPPPGYGGVLTRQQWLGAIAFSNAVDAPIVTSMPDGDGARGSDGVWKPDQARIWLDFTKAHGGKIAAAEYFNEPTLASMGVHPRTTTPRRMGAITRFSKPLSARKSRASRSWRPDRWANRPPTGVSPMAAMAT
ncbi:hypothetical protein ACFSTJ_17455 [Ottowia pentelensis]|uniref:hypothetical protein n=1 Tax=Ottowia pentelensis TaxID=511108 RepID=UPI003633AD3A